MEKTEKCVVFCLTKSDEATDQWHFSSARAVLEIYFLIEF